MTASYFYGGQVVGLVDETDGRETHPGAQGVREIGAVLALDKDAA